MTTCLKLQVMLHIIASQHALCEAIRMYAEEHWPPASARQSIEWTAEMPSKHDHKMLLMPAGTLHSPWQSMQPTHIGCGRRASTLRMTRCC